jgi:hypothetical protein
MDLKSMLGWREIVGKHWMEDGFSTQTQSRTSVSTWMMIKNVQLTKRDLRSVDHFHSGLKMFVPTDHGVKLLVNAQG